MVNRHRKISHSTQRKRIMQRQKSKVHARRHTQFILEQNEASNS
jgi:hypothetical protein